jgi:hypothetical protein
MNTIKNIILVAACALFIGVIFVTFQASQLSAAQPDLEARIAKTSTSSVGVYASSEIAREVTSCASRVITTNERIYLSFDEDFTPTGPTAGHYQAASTTVTYESDLFGCGAITARAGATTTITMTEFRF